MINKGDIIILSNGSYSDYQIRMVCRALESFDVSKLKEQFVKCHKPDNWGYFSHSTFAHWLSNEAKLVEEIKHKEINAGDYDVDPILC